jgi:hypothetical protein
MSFVRVCWTIRNFSSSSSIVRVAKLPTQRRRAHSRRRVAGSWVTSSIIQGIQPFSLL